MNLKPAPSDSTLFVKLKVVNVFVFGDVWVLLIKDVNSMFDELAIVATGPLTPKSTVPPVPPPVKLIVGDVIATSLSAFAKTKSSVCV